MTRILNSIFSALLCLAATPAGAQVTPIDELCVHDPCILADKTSQTYYIYRSFSPSRYGEKDKPAGIQAFTSKDLTTWNGPTTVFEIPQDFWADRDTNPWAPEVHAYGGKYYLFVTFNAWQEKLDDRPGRPFINKRASQILVSDSPLGPFEPFANKPHTPDGEMTLDATLWVEDGQPWLVYCHEWVQLGNGLIKAIRLKPDLSETIGEPITLINAGDLDWTKKEINYQNKGPVPGVVTDGPFLYRTTGGKLLLFWSSWTKDRAYAQTLATSDTGKLAGPWTHRPEPILQDDRGHGMVFRDFNDRLLLCLHRYFHQPATRVQLWELKDTGDSVELGRQVLGAP